MLLNIIKISKYKECLTECLKALESTIMIILDKNKISFDKKDKISTHIELLFQNKVLPPYLKEEFNNLIPLLSSAVSSIRNKVSGHGDGVSKNIVTRELSSYMLHLTTTNILFLIENDRLEH